MVITTLGEHRSQPNMSLLYIYCIVREINAHRDYFLCTQICTWGQKYAAVIPQILHGCFETRNFGPDKFLGLFTVNTPGDFPAVFSHGLTLIFSRYFNRALTGIVPENVRERDLWTFAFSHIAPPSPWKKFWKMSWCLKAAYVWDGLNLTHIHLKFDPNSWDILHPPLHTHRC